MLQDSRPTFTRADSMDKLYYKNWVPVWHYDGAVITFPSGHPRDCGKKKSHVAHRACSPQTAVQKETPVKQVR